MSAGSDLFTPGSDEYISATSPDNSSVGQRPAFVATPTSADGVAAVVREAIARGLIVQPQATGHGAGATIDERFILLDSSGLDHVRIDPKARSATAEAGSQWGGVQAAAFPYGLLGLGGSSRYVGISGYTFGGGIGWLTRPHGLAAAALRRVEFVDGNARIHNATEDAADQDDRDALWAFRGGGGVGIATELEFDLVSIPNLYAGYLLWTVDHLPAIAQAWASTVTTIGDDVTTSIAVRPVPPTDQFPRELHGQKVVHLAIACCNGEETAIPMMTAVRKTATPVIDTWGPGDLEKLVGIHLDPMGAIPAVGVARWLNDITPDVTEAMLSLAAEAESGLALAEIRNVSNNAVSSEGALSRVPGQFVSHGVGVLEGPGNRKIIDHALARLMSIAQPHDVGLSVGSWMEGAASVPDALPADIRDRVANIADAIDPNMTIARSRLIT